MLPAGRVSARDIAEYNDQQELDAAQIRDFLILHYKVTNRRDSPFWRHCADMPIPDSLDQKIELFRETGRVFRRNEELFAENSWRSEEHTSELQSLMRISYAVFCLKKKKKAQ